MTTEHQEYVEQPARAMAWGQLVVGGVIGGIALWSMVMPLFGVAPSALLEGVASTYHAWRDWLLTPLLTQFAIDLTAPERDVLTYVLIMAAAWVRTALRYPEAWDGVIDLVLWPTLATVSVFYLVPERWSPSFGVVFWLSVAAIICTMRLLIRPVAGLAASKLVDENTAALLGDLTAPATRFGLWNALAVFAFAAGLMVLDWAVR